MRQNDYASSVYVAYSNGDFFILRRLTTVNRTLFEAPENAQWLVQSIRFLDTAPETRVIFLDGAQQVIAEKIRATITMIPALVAGLF